MRGTRLRLGLAGALLLTSFSLPPGALAATGGISGAVTGAGAGPLNEARVCARSDSSSFSLRCTTTNVSGQYTIPNLEEGGYRVDFEASGEFIGQWFKGVETEAEATDVAVVGGPTTPGIDAELTRGAAIEGTVTDAESGVGVGQIRVCTSLAEGDPIGSVCGTSESNGHYRIVGIPGGAYKVRFEPVANGSDYLRQFWQGAQIFAAGTTVQLTDSATKAGVDAAMQLGGTISGTVLDENGEPVKGLSVCTYPVLGNTNLSYCFENEAESATDGTYTIHGLYSGEYKIHFFGGGNYLGQWYPGVQTRADATAISVTAPAGVTGVDATLQSGGVISGTLLESGSHNPIPFADICAKPVGGTSLYCSQAKAGGEYRIQSLPSREYVVEFAGPNNSTDWPYVPSFSGGTTDPAAATPVSVTAGSEAAGVDGEVEKGGTITGHVSDAVSYESAFGIDACAYADGKVVGHCDTTGNEGNYTIIGLPSGSYAVHFVPAGGGVEENFRIGNPHYLSQFYDDAATASAATPIASGPGMAVTGKDVEMHEGGGISGTVTGPLSEPLRESEACIVESAADPGGPCGRANVDGEYEIAGLYPGSYIVRFRSSGGQQNELAPEYFEDVLGFGEAEPVTVTGTGVTEHIDAHLIPGGTMEGTVVDAFDGTPIAGAEVCAEAISALGGNCAESQSDGHYSMQLTPGSYNVKFSLGYEEVEAEVAEFVTQYFDRATEAGAASPVSIASEATVTGIDAALEPAAGRLDMVAVTRGGGGSGAVTSSPAGIDCGATCTDSFETRKTVTLQAEPAPGSVFTGWTGACSGTGACQIRLTAGANVAATFEPSGEMKPTPPPVEPVPPGKVSPSPKKPLKCKKGFKKKAIGGVERCVKQKSKKKHPRKHHAKRR
jgi:hypothetical protein